MYCWLLSRRVLFHLGLNYENKWQSFFEIWEIKSQRMNISLRRIVINFVGYLYIVLLNICKMYGGKTVYLPIIPIVFLIIGPFKMTLSRDIYVISSGIVLV